MERATYASKSFLVGLALVKGHIDVEQAAQAAHVEVNSQIERWGEVEDSASPPSPPSFHLCSCKLRSIRDIITESLSFRFYGLTRSSPTTLCSSS